MNITFTDLSEDEARAVVSWRRYYLSLVELDNLLRCDIKYNDYPDDVREAYEHVRNMIRIIMEDYGCSLEDLE